MNVRTTIVVNETLLNRAQEYVKQKKSEGEKTDLSKFLNQAIINELERLGDFEVRDIYEGELENGNETSQKII